MPSGKSSKAAVRNARSVVTATKPRPWGTVVAVLTVLVFAVGIFGYLYMQYEDRRAYTPTVSDKDPSTHIKGIVIHDYGAANRGHIGADKRVAYDHSPPFGGPHDATWIACNPAKINGPALQSLQDRVQGSNYLMLSPYTGLDSPISLQSWGHQLKLSNPADKRIDQFIQSLRLNQYTYPEVGASCDELPGLFDPAKPPPFVAAPPGPGAIPMNYGGGRGVAPSTGEAPTAPGGTQSTPGLPAG